MRKLIVMTAALTAVALGNQGAMGYYAGQISKQQAAKICGGNWDCSDEVCSVAGCESCTNKSCVTVTCDSAKCIANVNPTSRTGSALPPNHPPPQGQGRARDGQYQGRCAALFGR